MHLLNSTKWQEFMTLIMGRILWSSWRQYCSLKPFLISCMWQLYSSTNNHIMCIKHITNYLHDTQWSVTLIGTPITYSFILICWVRTEAQTTLYKVIQWRGSYCTNELCIAESLQAFILSVGFWVFWPYLTMKAPMGSNRHLLTFSDLFLNVSSDISGVICQYC